MPECLPDLPRYIRRIPDGSWLGAPGKHGPWRSIPAPQSGLPWPTDGPAVPESREPASVAPEATGQPRPLSPAAQTIVQVFDDRYELCGPFDDNWQELCLAAALEALADQVVPEGRALMIRMPEADVDGNELGGMLLTAEPNDRIRHRILAIVAELEGRHG